MSEKIHYRSFLYRKFKADKSLYWFLYIISICSLFFNDQSQVKMSRIKKSQVVGQKTVMILYFNLEKT